jgi:hypothetical protein
MYSLIADADFSQACDFAARHLIGIARRLQFEAQLGAPEELLIREALLAARWANDLVQLKMFNHDGYRSQFGLGPRQPREPDFLDATEDN